MEEYLTVKELSERIKLAVQTIYNFIHEGKFVLGKHYLKPTPKKILFRWSEIQSWMGGGDIAQEGEEEMDSATAAEAGIQAPGSQAKPRAPRQAKSLINI